MLLFALVQVCTYTTDAIIKSPDDVSGLLEACDGGVVCIVVQIVLRVGIAQLNRPPIGT